MLKFFQLHAVTFLLCTVAVIAKQCSQPHPECSLNNTDPKVLHLIDNTRWLQSKKRYTCSNSKALGTYYVSKFFLDSSEYTYSSKSV